MEDFQCLLALGELGVLDEEVVELDDAIELVSSSLELLREALLVIHELVGCAWLWLDLNRGGLVAPQVLEILSIVVLDVVPQHLVRLGIVALTLPLLDGVVIAFLVLA